jgi:hypothetical protein
MEAMRLTTTVEKDGEIILKNLPFKEGQAIEMILLVEPLQTPEKLLTANLLLNSTLIGLWKDRAEIGNSASYARNLRERAQTRS